MAKERKALVWDGKELKEVIYDKSYEFIRATVDGYIEHIPLKQFESRYIDVWCNEEGKLRSDLEPTMVLTYNGKPYDVVMGNVVFLRYNQSGSSLPLRSSDIAYIKELFRDAPYTNYFTGLVLPAFSY